MRLKQLNEGVRYGAKQRNEVISNLSEFAFGFEIEMNPPVGDMEHEYVVDEVIDRVNNNFIVRETIHDELADVIERVVDTSVISEFFGDSDVTTSTRFLDSEIIESLHNATDVGGTVDMFPSEAFHAILSELNELSKDANRVDIVKTLNNLERYEDVGLDRFFVLGAFVKNDDIDEEHYENVNVDRLNEFASLYGSLLTKLSNVVIDNDLEQFINDGEVIDYAQLSNDDKTVIGELYDSLRGDIRDVYDACDDIMNHPLYLDNIEYGITDDSDRKNTIHVMLDFINDDYMDFVPLMRELNLSDQEINSIISYMYEYRIIIDDIIDDIEQGTDVGNVEEFFNSNIIPRLSTNASSFDYTTDTEHDEQLEVILETPVLGTDIIKAFKAMYEIIDLLSDEGFTTASNSGLHMSISYKGGSKPLNKYKFIVLSHIYDMVDKDHNMVRRFVNDIFGMVKNENELDDFINNLVMSTLNSESTTVAETVMDYVEDQLNFSGKLSIDAAKYHGINFNGYHTQDGRIELRFFGGEDFEGKYKEYLDILLRFMYILKVSTDDTHDQEYMKTVFRTMNKVLERSSIKAGILEIRDRIKKVSQMVNSTGYDFNNSDSLRKLALYIDSKRNTLTDNVEDRNRIQQAIYAMQDGNYKSMIQPDAMKGIKIIQQWYKSKS